MKKHGVNNVPARALTFGGRDKLEGGMSLGVSYLKGAKQNK